MMRRILKILAKLPIIMLATIGRRRYWGRSLKFMIAAAVTFLVWIAAKYIHDKGWDAPKDFSQIEQLQNPIGWRRDELRIDLEHWGSQESKQETPYTNLVHVGFGEKAISIDEFSNKYFEIIPVQVPRNNPMVIMSPVNKSLGVNGTFERLVEDGLAQKKPGGWYKPSVYSIELHTEIDGHPQQFSRRYNFRSRNWIEVAAFGLGGILFGCFVFLFLNLPTTIWTIYKDEQLSSLLEYIFTFLYRLLKIVPIVGEPIANFIDLVLNTVSDTIKLHEKLGKDRRPETIQELHNREKQIAQILQNRTTLDQESANQVIVHLFVIYRIVLVIDYRILIEKKREDLARIEEVVQKEKDLQNDKQNLQNLIEKLLKQVNRIREELKRGHQKKIAEAQQKIVEKFTQGLHAPDFQERLRWFADPSQKIVSKQEALPLEGLEEDESPAQFIFTKAKFGDKEGEIQIYIPQFKDYLKLSLQPRDKKVAITQVGSIEKGIAVQTVPDETAVVEYELLLKPLLLDPDDLPKALDSQAIELKPKDQKQLDRLFAPLKPEDIAVEEKSRA